MSAIPAVTENHRRRLHRFNQPGTARSLTFSGFHRQPFLASDRTRTWLIEAIDKARTAHGFHLWAYVFMPEHAHILIFPNHQRPNVGPILSTIKQSVAKRALIWVQRNAPHFLKHMSDVAPNGAVTHRFWQRGAGYDRNLWSPDHIWETIDYIHLNPIRRGLCARPTDWPYSSANAFESHTADPLAIDFASIPPKP